MIYTRGQTLVAEKRKIYFHFQSRTVAYNEYKKIKKRVNAEIQSIKNVGLKFSLKMEHNLYGGQKRVWNMLRNRRKFINELINTNAITTKQ